MVDITALAAAIGALGPTVASVWNVIREASTRNQSVSRDEVHVLAQQMEALSKQMNSVSRMGNALDDYVRSLVRALETQAACDRLRDFVFDNRKSLANPEDPLHEAHWRNVEFLVQAVSSAKAGNIQVILDRIEFLDEGDATAIRVWVDQFNTNYAQALSEKNARRPDPLLQRAEAMGNTSGQIRQVFENTIFNRMIRSLAEIGD